MSTEYSFNGQLQYDDEASLEAALDEASALLDEEDEELADLARSSWDEWFVAEGASVQVAIELSGPSDWWFALEGLVEAITAEATEGWIDARHEGDGDPDGVVRYHAGGESEGGDGDDD